MPNGYLDAKSINWDKVRQRVQARRSKEPKDEPIPERGSFESTVNALETPGNYFNRGVSELATNPIKGMIDMSLGLVHTPLLIATVPFGMLDDALSQGGEVGKQSASTLNTIFELPSQLVRTGKKLIDVGFEKTKTKPYMDLLAQDMVQETRKRMGLPPSIDPGKEAEEIAESLLEGVELGATLLTFRGLHQGAKTIKKGMGVPEDIKAPIYDKPYLYREGEPLEPKALPEAKAKYKASEVGDIAVELPKEQQIQLSRLKLEKDNLSKTKEELSNQFNKLKKEKGTLKERRSLAKEINNITDAISAIDQKVLGFGAEQRGLKGLLPERGVTIPLEDVSGKNIPSTIDFTSAKEPGKVLTKIGSERLLPVKRGVEVETPKGVRLKDPETGKFIKAEVKDAERISKDEGKVQERGDVRQVSEAEVRKDLERKTPKEPRREGEEVKKNTPAIEIAEKPQPTVKKPVVKVEEKIIEPNFDEMSNEQISKFVDDLPLREADGIIPEVNRVAKNLLKNQPIEVVKQAIKNIQKDEFSINLQNLQIYADALNPMVSKEMKSFQQMIKKKIVEPQAKAKQSLLSQLEPRKKELEKQYGKLEDLSETELKNIVKPSKRIFNEEQYKEDIKNIKNKPLTAGFDPRTNLAYMRAGGYHLENIIKSGIEKGQQFAEWNKKMVEEIGKEIKPHLGRIWSQVNTKFETEFKHNKVINEIIGGNKELRAELEKNRQNFALKESKVEKVKKSIEKETKSIADWGKKYLKPKDTRLYEISPDIYRMTKRNAYETSKELGLNEDIGTNLVSKWKDLPQEVKADIDYLIKSKRVDKAEQVFNKLGMNKEWTEVRKLLDNLGNKLDLEKKIKDYFPLMVDDYKGLMNEFYPKIKERYGLETELKIKSIIDELIQRKEAKLGKELTIEEKAHLINNVFRGYNPGIKLSKIANERERVLKVLDADLMKYYHESSSSLLSYIAQATEIAKKREFFGKNIDIDFNDKSLGRMIADKFIDAKLSAEQVNELVKIFKSGFEPKGATGWVSSFRELGYLTRLFNFIGAMTQFGDFYTSLYRSPGRAFQTVGKAFTRSSEITLKDIGWNAEQYARELLDPRNRGKVMKWTAKKSLFHFIDVGMKETYINTLYYKYHYLARKGKLTKDSPNYWRFEKRFGKEADAVIKEFAQKRENLTERQAFMLFDELDTTQPYTVWSTPEGFHTSGNMQIAYQFKTFAIRRLDFIMNETVRRIRNPELSKTERIRAAKNLFYLTGIIALTEGSVDVLKDIVKGKKINLSDIAFDNLMRLVLLSRYDANNIRKDGFFSALAQKLTFTTSFADDILKDLVGIYGGDFKGRSIRNLPIIGEVIYNRINTSVKKYKRR